MLLLYLLALLQGATALLNIPVARRSRVLTSSLHKREQNTTIRYLRPEAGYFLNITLGTPPQIIGTHVDTGSGDLWVPAVNSSFCNTTGSLCDDLGSFNVSNSTTVQLLSSAGPFTELYGDGTTVNGSYVQDTVDIWGSEIKNVIVGLVNQGQRGQMNEKLTAVSGLGFPSTQSIKAVRGLAPHDNLLASMVASNVTATRAFSLWLNDVDSDIGALLFGGVDTAKFIPPLMTIPLEPLASTGQVIKYVVSMTGLSFYTNTSNTTIGVSSPLAVLLDSGTTNTQLPQSMIDQMYKGLGVVMHPDFGPLLSCSLKTNTTGFVFNFAGPNGPNITVPLYELLETIRTSDGRALRMDTGDEACIFGFRSTNTTNIVLGDAFLRAAYVVFDQENQQVALANSFYNATGENVQPIPKGTSIPFATPVQNPVRASYVPPASDIGQYGVPTYSPKDTLLAADFGGIVTTTASTIATSLPTGSFTGVPPPSYTTSAGATASAAAARLGYATESVAWGPMGMLVLSLAAGVGMVMAF